MIDKVVRMRS